MLTWVLLTLAITTAPPPPSPQPPAPPPAADARTQAEQLARSGSYRAALERFQALAAANPDDLLDAGPALGPSDLHAEREQLVAVVQERGAVHRGEPRHRVDRAAERGVAGIVLRRVARELGDAPRVIAMRVGVENPLDVAQIDTETPNVRLDQRRTSRHAAVDQDVLEVEITRLRRDGVERGGKKPCAVMDRRDERDPDHAAEADTRARSTCSRIQG